MSSAMRMNPSGRAVARQEPPAWPARQELMGVRVSITSYDEFMAQVEQTKQTGFAYDREENEPSLLCIAVPIYDFLEQAVASMSMSFPTFRCDDEKFARYHEIMKQAAIELELLDENILTF